MAPSPCIVQLCKNIGTHRLPKNEERKAQWLQAISHIKPGLTVRTNSLICSSHFRPTDFVLTPTFWTKLDRAPKLLKKNAIPSLFPWYHVSQEQVQTFKINQLLQEEEQVSSSQSINFDYTKVKSTYSRSPRIQFVEELPFIEMEVATSDMLEDPLQLSDEEFLQSSNQETEPLNDDEPIEIEIALVNDSTVSPVNEQSHSSTLQFDEEIQTEKD